MAISPRVGRTASKEEYAFFYRYVRQRLVSLVTVVTSVPRETVYPSYLTSVFQCHGNADKTPIAAMRRLVLERMYSVCHFFRKGQGLTLTGSYMYDDGSETVLNNGTHVDLFEREPYIVAFTSNNTGTSEPYIQIPSIIRPLY